MSHRRWNRSVSIMLYLIFFGIGIAHLRLGTRAIFLFGQNEPAVSWMFVSFGPLLTLPAVVLSLFYEKAASYFLIAGGIISFISLVFVEHLDLNGWLMAFSMIYVPMVAIAITLLLRKRVRTL